VLRVRDCTLLQQLRRYHKFQAPVLIHLPAISRPRPPDMLALERFVFLCQIFETMAYGAHTMMLLVSCGVS
jgi:hypothetical protein